MPMCKRLASVTLMLVLPVFMGVAEANNFFNNQNVQVQGDYQSVQVRTLPDGNYHAELSYRDQDGVERNFSYQGSKELIITQVQQQTDLPDDKKWALLNALEMNAGNPQNLFNQPFFQGNLFDDPFFTGPPLQGDPLDHPFFNSPFFQGNPFDHPFFKNDWLNDPFFSEPLNVVPPARPKPPPQPDNSQQRGGNGSAVL